LVPCNVRTTVPISELKLFSARSRILKLASSLSSTPFPLPSMPPPLLRLPNHGIRNISAERRAKPPHDRVCNLSTIHACVVVAFVVLVLLGEEAAFLVLLCHVWLKGRLGAGGVGGGHWCWLSCPVLVLGPQGRGRVRKVWCSHCLVGKEKEIFKCAPTGASWDVRSMFHEGRRTE
jgi:hypothetical protein